MKKGSIIAINRSEGTTITCKEGNIWLTEPGSKDIHLAKGELHHVLSGGKIVVEAITKCAVEFL